MRGYKLSGVTFSAPKPINYFCSYLLFSCCCYCCCDLCFGVFEEGVKLFAEKLLNYHSYFRYVANSMVKKNPHKTIQRKKKKRTQVYVTHNFMLHIINEVSSHHFNLFLNFLIKTQFFFSLTDALKLDALWLSCLKA